VEANDCGSIINWLQRWNIPFSNHYIKLLCIYPKSWYLYYWQPAFLPAKRIRQSLQRIPAKGLQYKARPLKQIGPWLNFLQMLPTTRLYTVIKSSVVNGAVPIFMN
jgi:hypothetical protein